MIEFKNFPPVESGDVEFTSGALASFKSLGRELDQDFIDAELRKGLENKAFAYGESVGRTVVAALDVPRKRTAEAIITPLSIKILMQAGGASVGFMRGSKYGIQKELSRQQERYRIEQG